MNFSIIPLALFLMSSLSVFAHPSGNMITVGEDILWSYVSPINDPDHKGCIMISTNGEVPRVLIESDHHSSDFMLSANGNDVYCIERRYRETSGSFEVRVLRMAPGRNPVVIWDWFKDNWRVGEGGFFMINDELMVFGRYPGVYSLVKGGNPEVYFQTVMPVKRIRATEDNCILLLGDRTCHLVDQEGAVLRQWQDLIDDKVGNAPLGRNQLFDADYRGGELLLAYWGNRSFITIDDSGKRRTLLQQEAPLVPHWVAFFGEKKLLFSSRFYFDGTPPQPHLTLFHDKKDAHVIWKTQ